MWCTLDKTYGELWHKSINWHDSPSYYTAWTLNLERILSMYQNQQEVLTYGRDPKVIIYPYGLGHYWWRLVATGILNKGTMISLGIEIECPLGWSKEHVIMKSMAIIIPLVKFDIFSLELQCVSWSHNKWDYNSRISEAIFIGDSITLLDYGHQSMGSLHAVDSKSRNWALGIFL